MNQQEFNETLRKSQRAQADISAWGAVIDLLVGCNSPGVQHHHRAVQQVVKIAMAERKKALKRMETSDEQLKAATVSPSVLALKGSPVDECDSGTTKH